MRDKVRRALDLIDEVLAEKNKDSADLAAILSALRGPDLDDDNDDVRDLKSMTTAAIRTIAFPRTESRGSWNRGWLEINDTRGWIMNSADTLQRPKEGDSLHSHGTGRGHFLQHVHMAIDAIEREEDGVVEVTKNDDEDQD